MTKDPNKIIDECLGQLRETWTPYSKVCPMFAKIFQEVSQRDAETQRGLTKSLIKDRESGDPLKESGYGQLS